MIHRTHQRATQVVLAQRFDPGSRRLVGEAVPVAEGVQYDPGFFRGVFSASDNGVLLYGFCGRGRSLRR